MFRHNGKRPRPSLLLLENEKFFELKSKEYRDGIKRKRQDRGGV